MQIEKRLIILKEVELTRKKIAEPTFWQRFPFIQYGFAFLSTFFGIYSIAIVIEKIGKVGVTPFSVVLLFLGIVFISFQWVIIATQNYNKKLLLIYEALLANNSNELDSVA